jgi:hypothetical protein
LVLSVNRSGLAADEGLRPWLVAAHPSERKVLQMKEQMILPDYDAVRHVLSAPQIAARTAGYIGRDDFDFAGLTRETETMSSGEKLLVEIANDLWNAKRVVGVCDLVRRLDQTNFDRVLAAFRIARGPHASNVGELFVSEEEELAA